jgi:hypothetical protein
MRLAEYILKITTNTLGIVHDENMPIGRLIGEGKRIGELRGDYKSLWWLEWELHSIESPELKSYPRSIVNKFSENDFAKLSNEFWEKWIAERQVNTYDKKGNLLPKDNICTLGVLEIESKINFFEKQKQSLRDTSGMAPLDIYYVEIDNTNSKTWLNLQIETYGNILKRIRSRIFDYVSSVETELVSGKTLSNFFENNKTIVERYLNGLSPDFSQHLEEISNRLREGSSVSYSQALLLVRILFKKYADIVYPASDNEVEGIDGKKRVLGEPQYISRIWQYMHEHRKKGDEKLLKSQLTDLGNRIDEVYYKSCKGVHEEVTVFEAQQCVIQMYMCIGDIIRLTDNYEE